MWAEKEVARDAGETPEKEKAETIKHLSIYSYASLYIKSTRP